MGSAAPATDLWALTRGRPQIDPDDLAGAVRRAVDSADLDFRTRLLVRDSLDALRSRWGPARFERWLAAAPNRPAIEHIRRSDLGPPGFPSIERRLMETTRLETVLQFLRELGASLQHATRVSIGGSASLIVAGKLSRATEDVDVVDEVPAEIRTQYDLLERLAARYGLRIAHFQSHYLPTGWADRVRSLGRLGQLEVYLVDEYDVFLSKLFSRREKDRDDLRLLAPQLDRQTAIARLRDATGPLRADEDLHQTAAENWYILFGEPLPA